ncbi:GntR family transcriptional regulator [Paracraurococcus lichenis]|uniref:GntR family transcriptional regulator n=1 Tax=Paracraurococcus lichenis TaxID=3064888 RepID=A0ABT9DZ76_9PROT|nr:GntR family transcriptional regulator [Paracraurococcus sp. LOR1-02]MDO9709217.1 GntR family transcriptional regulator [Paracraurococcus sp. LOR1-02]
MSAAAPHPVARLAEEDTLSLAERAYRRLRDAIVQGALPSGSRISERSLAASLGISAQPVREALRRLEQDGMVVTLPRRGTVVADFGPERQAEMGRIRAALEGAAAALTAGRADAEALAALAAQLAAMREATAAGKPDLVSAANERFHGLIHEATGNVFLIRSLAALRAYDHFGRVRALNATPTELPRALEEHAGILAALQARDPDLAETRMRAHVLRSLEVGGLLPTTSTRNHAP